MKKSIATDKASRWDAAARAKQAAADGAEETEHVLEGFIISLSR